MFWKSLQLKLILIFFILISTTTIGIGVYSINKIEEVYYNGFIEEILSTISSFGLNMETMKQHECENLSAIFPNNDSITIEQEAILKKETEEKRQEILKRVYDNFNIYFCQIFPII